MYPSLLTDPLRRLARWAAAFLLAALCLGSIGAWAQVSESVSGPSETALREQPYYEIASLPLPEGLVLEVGGLVTLRDGRLAVTTRRGDVWLVENPGMEGGTAPHYTRYAQGLHEPLGIAQLGDALYVAQRPGLTRLRDTNGDDRADRYETVYRFPVSGNYHEYAFGPEVTPDGNLRVTLNLAWIGRMASPVPWRGWMLEITPEGEMAPIATGMRSPAGFGYNTEGDIFYADNQGGWIGSGRITHVEPGDFVGHPGGLAWSDGPTSPVELDPEDVPDTGRPMHEVEEDLPGLKLPAVWLPHGIMGISTSDILVDTTGGAFGPFTGQLFVGDQGHSKISRVFLEKVKGEYQGAAFLFREGFASGVLRIAWGRDGAMYVGQTSRGWRSLGPQPYALQRLEWTGQMPFEVQEVRARPDGFELVFTRPVTQETANDLSAYDVTSFTYKYHSSYGSPVVDRQDHRIEGVSVADDGRSVRVALDEMRRGHIYEIKLPGLRTPSGDPLLHNTGYYTLNRLPDGSVLARGEMTAVADEQETAAAPQEAEAPAPSARPATEQPKHQTELPAAWTGGPDTTITIGTRPGLRYDLEQFQVPAGSRVKLVFRNDDDMLHNLNIVQPGSWQEVAQMAIDMGIEGPEQEYVPESDKVLFHTSLLQPGEMEPIYFTAPRDPDQYTYVCTFPGHAETMRGIMQVVAPQQAESTSD